MSRFVPSNGNHDREPSRIHHSIFQNLVIKNESMDQVEINNWKTIAEKMEASGGAESWFYLRARAIADGKIDPMPTVSELMAKSA